MLAEGSYWVPTRTAVYYVDCNYHAYTAGWPYRTDLTGHNGLTIEQPDNY